MNVKVLQLVGGIETNYPHALEQQFPHMLNRIVELWNSSELDPYLEQLMLDTRDHQRKGFPSDVATDILRLSRISGEQRQQALQKQRV